ncbi:nucleoside hydrolase [Schlesneria paludicola]|uniref:nucleoside hydrolase n=1 Tax=Schlesneria paludicola TaxID=360056 RepID=UPI00029A5593|nr:nucleoside hydrolase [Schlesneria paludicola]
MLIEKFAIRLTLTAVLMTFSLSALAAEPVRLIFDTDIGNDVDDVQALGVIHALQSRGACQLLGVTITKDNELAGPFIDLINTFYHRGDIPIGTVRQGKTPEPGTYLPLAAELINGKFRYPHDLLSSKDAPEAVGLLRKLLAAQPDGSVAIAQVGFSTNLARLLDSKADDWSPLSGRDLIKAKVSLLSVMAGAFQPINGNAHYCEYNVVQDIANCRKLADEWPTPVVWSGFEIGIAVPYPESSIKRDYGYSADHPVAESYRRYVMPPGDRPTWDLTSVLYAVYPDRGYFDLSEPGRIAVEGDGFTKFAPDAQGRHRYLKLTETQRTRVLEALVQLSSQPPSK